MRRSLVTVPALVLLATLLTAIAVAAADDPATVFQRFIDARNAGDVAGALALVTDDIVFVGGPNCAPPSPCVGTAAVREQVQGFIADRVWATGTGPLQVSGDTVRGRFEVRGTPYTAAGIDRAIVDIAMDFRAGRIAAYRSVPDASDPQTARFLDYQRTHQPPAPGTMPGLPNTGGGGLAARPRGGAADLLGGGGALLGGLLLAATTRCRRAGRGH